MNPPIGIWKSIHVKQARRVEHLRAALYDLEMDLLNEKSECKFSGSGIAHQEQLRSILSEAQRALRLIDRGAK